jgi:lipopolysaccharide transport system ATP-binding protein
VQPVNPSSPFSAFGHLSFPAVPYHQLPIMNTVISVENFSKRYRLGVIGSSTFRHDFDRWWARARNRPDPLIRVGETDHGNHQGEMLWVLKDFNF